jgi:2-polyprenyl-3-methyl-5-hydroxy-6-metoxy-1,4-benzoquinol methylase
MTSPRPKDTDLGRYYQSENYISHSSRPTSLLDRAYWLARQFALRTKYHLVNESNPKTVLDYGCGTGSFLEYCKKKGKIVTGVEPSLTARMVATSKIAPQAVHENINNIKDSFDTVTLWHVLEHVADLNSTISELKAVLNPNGNMFIAVPNITSWESIIYGQYWAAYDVPRHLWHFTPATITKLFQRHDLILKKIVPMKLDSYYISLLSEKYKRNQKNALFGMINAGKNGFISNQKAQNTGAYSSLIYIFQHA